MSSARYFFPHDYDESDFEPFVARIDEELLMEAADLIEEFRLDLDEVNCAHGIEADHSFGFRLLEYGRHRLITLKKLGMLDVLFSKEPPQTEQERAVRAAFELGSAASEHRVMRHYEEYLRDGMAMSEWREDGLPKARAERLRQGERSRSAIARAAKQLYAENPELLRNDTETARAIQAMHLDELQKGGGGQQLGIDAITKHLRESRRTERSREN